MNRNNNYINNIIYPNMNNSYINNNTYNDNNNHNNYYTP